MLHGGDGIHPLGASEVLGSEAEEGHAVGCCFCHVESLGGPSLVFEIHLLLESHVAALFSQCCAVAATY